MVDDVCNVVGERLTAIDSSGRVIMGLSIPNNGVLMNGEISIACENGVMSFAFSRPGNGGLVVGGWDFVTLSCAG